MESITLKTSSSSSSPSPEPLVTNKSKSITDEQKEKDGNSTEKMDRFGDYVCTLLNQGAFRNINHNTAYSPKHSFRFVPLFSASNVRWIQDKYTRIKTALSMKTPSGNQRYTILQSLRLLIGVLFISSVAIAALTVMFLTIVIRVYLFVFLTVVSFLFDLNDVYDYLPKKVHLVIGRIKSYWDKMDRRYLHANDLKGRNLWYEEETLRQDLIERSIPSSLNQIQDENGNITSKKDLHTQDWNILKEELRSKGLESKTVDHNLAVNFCCVMIHGKHNPLLNMHKKDFQQVVKTIIDLGKVDDKHIEVIRDLSVSEDDIHSHSNEGQTIDEIYQINELRQSKSYDLVDDLSSPLEIRRSSSDAGQKWLDVGTKLGLRLLKSETMKKAMLQSKSSTDKPHIEEDLVLDTIGDDNIGVTTERIRPIHPMWSPGLGDHESVQSAPSESECNDECSQVSTDSFDVHSMSNVFSPYPSPARLISRRLSNGQISLSRQSSPSRSLGRIKENGNWSDISHENSLVPSPIQWVPKAFDASKHLPAALALNHNDKPSKRVVESKIKPTRSQQMPKVKPIVKTKQFKKRPPLLPGVKMLIPISKSSSQKSYQLVTVHTCARIQLDTSFYGDYEDDRTDALSICAYIDKSFLRNGGFAMISLRIPDSQRQFPRHSKFPIGSPIMTSFGVGVLIGWRSKDDCHIVRSLWKKRGRGSGHGYFNRDALHSVAKAGIGFKVQTILGPGKVMGIINDNKYVVQVKRNGVNTSELKTMDPSEILACPSAKFIPVVEQIREAAKYRIQLDIYHEEKLNFMLEDEMMVMDKTWRVFSEGFEMFLTSFIAAAEEDSSFDGEISNFLSSFIHFLEDFDLGGNLKGRKHNQSTSTELNLNISSAPILLERSPSETVHSTSVWLFNDLFLTKNINDFQSKKSPTLATHSSDDRPFQESYKKVYTVLRLMMRTINIAKAKCTDKPNLKLGLTIVHEFLLFVYNAIKVQQVNMSKKSIEDWIKTLKLLEEVFGPTNARLRKIGSGIFHKIEEHGKVAKIRAIKFADYLVSDEKLIASLETGDISEVILRVEDAAIAANILSENLKAQYHELGVQLYHALVPNTNQNPEAAYRNGKKLTFLAKTLKLLATPSRSLLVLLTNNDILGILERILVRVFERDEEAPQIVNIYCWNLRTLRHLRLLSNMSLVGRIWSPVLDAADEEFAWATSMSPVQTQDYIVPLSKLFSLGVARFHEIQRADSKVSLDWIDFLVEEDAIQIIQELDAALLMFLKNFCDDMKEMLNVLPYVQSIDDDILNMIDQVDVEQELREICEALADNQRFPNYIQQKGENFVNAVLDYLPKVSIPIERREIGEGWIVTCRGRNGKDLTLSNISIQKENLTCTLFGNQVFGFDEIEKRSVISRQSLSSVIKESTLQGDDEGNIEVSILDHIAELIRNAQSFGCWNVDRNSESEFRMSHKLQASSLNGLPLSDVLLCAIDLWEHLQIDDDELLEIAIGDISNEIRKVDSSKDAPMNDGFSKRWSDDAKRIKDMHQDYSKKSVSFENMAIVNTISFDNFDRRFDPTVDPTILYLHMSQLTCCLDDFTYRVEPEVRRSIFDPIFEGIGTLVIKNVSLKVRIELRKERIKKFENEVIVPVLQLCELDIGLEEVQFYFKETGLDWLLNKIIENFFAQLTQIVRDNLKSQINKSFIATLENLNNSLQVHPDMFLKILGISLDDLEDNVAWV